MPRQWSCATCMYFYELLGASECRRNPPVAQVLSIQAPVQLAGGGPKMMTLGVFAPTKPENWCGAWTPDVEDQPSPGATLPQQH